MEIVGIKYGGARTDQYRCVVCAARVESGYFCESCEREQLHSLEYAELFWDEV
jgi:hypothetical protein